MKKNPATFETSLEPSITHIWERFNPRWIGAGAVSGFLAGTLMMIILCALASKRLGEWTQPFKLIGTIIYGTQSTTFGALGKGGLAGLVIHYGLSTLYGITFAQLVDEKSKTRSLLILGGVTGFIIWIFGCMLFMPSVAFQIKMIISTSLSLYLHILFGISFGVILSFIRPFFGIRQ